MSAVIAIVRDDSPGLSEVVLLVVSVSDEDNARYATETIAASPTGTGRSR